MKILIVKTSSLGDIIHAFPTLEYLRHKFPQAQIDWVVEKPYAELLQAHPALNDVLEVDTKHWRKNFYKQESWRSFLSFRRSLQEVKYDLLLDLQGNVKSGLLTGQARTKIKIGFSKESLPEWPNLLFTDLRYTVPEGLNIRDEYLFLAKSYFNDWSIPPAPQQLLRLDPQGQERIDKILNEVVLRATPKVMVCPGSAWRNKQVDKGALIEFLLLLHEHLRCGYLFAWGTAEEKALAEELHQKFSANSVLLDRLPLPQLQNLMDKMSWVIAMDSLPLHLAGTTSTKTFSVFGASLATKYRPEGSQHLSYQGHCPYKRTFEKRCPILRTCPTGPCIRSITGASLFKYFKINTKD